MWQDAARAPARRDREGVGIVGEPAEPSYKAGTQQAQATAPSADRVPQTLLLRRLRRTAVNAVTAIGLVMAGTAIVAPSHFPTTVTVAEAMVTGLAVGSAAAIAAVPRVSRTLLWRASLATNIVTGAGALALNYAVGVPPSGLPEFGLLALMFAGWAMNIATCPLPRPQAVAEPHL